MAGESCGGGGWCACDVEGNFVPDIVVFGIVEVGIEVVSCIRWVGSDYGLTVWGCLGWNGPVCVGTLKDGYIRKVPLPRVST